MCALCALTHRGSTPLHFAACAKKNAMQACQALLDGGADTEVRPGRVGWSGLVCSSLGTAPAMCSRRRTFCKIRHVGGWLPSCCVRYAWIFFCCRSTSAA